jgi:type II secretory pathway component PulJ
MRHQTQAPGTGKTASGNAGFTLLELMLTGTLLAIAACGMAAVMVNSMVLTKANKENATAREAARQILEQIEDIPAREVFAVFGGGPMPAEEETATQEETATETLPPPPSSEILESGNLTARIVFPTGGTKGVLREDIKDPSLGMPRDLNGDGVIDSENHATDYRILPVKVEVTWNGVNGESTYEMCTVLLNE